MTQPVEDLKTVTRLVLYGWGYPTLFQKPNGDRLQNRLVIFPLHAPPVIEGAKKEIFPGVWSRLERVRDYHLDLLQSQEPGKNPLWVWVDTPKTLSIHDILDYRQQFEQWEERIQAEAKVKNRSRFTLYREAISSRLSRWHSPWPKPIAASFSFLIALLRWPLNHWKRAAIAIAVLTTLTLVALHG